MLPAIFAPYRLRLGLTTAWYRKSRAADQALFVPTGIFI
jgi:hypothetical protein